MATLAVLLNTNMDEPTFIVQQRSNNSGRLIRAEELMLGR
jgi:hypothetical protein